MDKKILACFFSLLLCAFGLSGQEVRDVGSGRILQEESRRNSGEEEGVVLADDEDDEDEIIPEDDFESLAVAGGLLSRGEQFSSVEEQFHAMLSRSRNFGHLCIVREFLDCGYPQDEAKDFPALQRELDDAMVSSLQELLAKKDFAMANVALFSAAGRTGLPEKRLAELREEYVSAVRPFVQKQVEMLLDAGRVDQADQMCEMMLRIYHLKESDMEHSRKAIGQKKLENAVEQFRYELYFQPTDISRLKSRIPSLARLGADETLMAALMRECDAELKRALQNEVKGVLRREKLNANGPTLRGLKDLRSVAEAQGDCADVVQEIQEQEEAWARTAWMKRFVSALNWRANMKEALRKVLAEAEASARSESELVQWRAILLEHVTKIYQERVSGLLLRERKIGYPPTVLTEMEDLVEAARNDGVAEELLEQWKASARTSFDKWARQEGIRILFSADGERRQMALEWLKENGAGQEVLDELARLFQERLVEEREDEFWEAVIMREYGKMLEILRTCEASKDFPPESLAEMKRAGDRIVAKQFIGRYLDLVQEKKRIRGDLQREEWEESLRTANGVMAKVQEAMESSLAKEKLQKALQEVEDKIQTVLDDAKARGISAEEVRRWDNLGKLRPLNEE